MLASHRFISVVQPLVISRHLLPLPRHLAPSREHQPLNSRSEREGETERASQTKNFPPHYISRPRLRHPGWEGSHAIGSVFARHGMAAMRCVEFGYGYGCASEHISCWIQPACLRQHCRQSRSMRARKMRVASAELRLLTAIVTARRTKGTGKESLTFPLRPPIPYHCVRACVRAWFFAWSLFLAIFPGYFSIFLFSIFYFLFPIIFIFIF